LQILEFRDACPPIAPRIMETPTTSVGPIIIPRKEKSPNHRLLETRINRIQTGRAIRRDRTRVLGDFLPAQFKRECEKPFRKLGQLSEIWEEHVPSQFCRKTRLASLNRGVLTVQVPDSSIAYDLERMLAAGVEQSIRHAFRGGTLRRIKVVVVVMNPQIKQIPD